MYLMSQTMTQMTKMKQLRTEINLNQQIKKMQDNSETESDGRSSNSEIDNEALEANQRKAQITETQPMEWMPPNRQF